MWTSIQFVRLTFDLIGRDRRGREAILRQQESQLRELLTYAAEHSPFYRDRLSGLDPQTCELSDIPPLDKHTMMEHFDDVVTDRRIRRADIEAFMNDPDNIHDRYLDRYILSHTSGSQGQPSLIVQEPDDVIRTFAVHFARGNPLDKTYATVAKRIWKPARLAVITQRPGFYPSGSAFAFLLDNTPWFVRTLQMSVFDPVEEMVAKLNEFQPNFIISYTSALDPLAAEERAGRLRLRHSGHLTQVTIIAEPLPDDKRRTFEESFGVTISNDYALGECMALTSGCPNGRGAHINEDLAIVEVVDENYRPVRDGQQGQKVLVTNLYNRVQPFIRYEVDDVLTISPQPCDCGSSLRLIESIEGRTSDQIWIEHDNKTEKVSPFVLYSPIENHLDLAEHQVIQTGRNKFVVRVATQPGATLSEESLAEEIRRSFRAEGYDVPIDVTVELVDDIPPDEKTGKTKRVINHYEPLHEERRALAG